MTEYIRTLCGQGIIKTVLLPLNNSHQYYIGITVCMVTSLHTQNLLRQVLQTGMTLNS